MAKPASDTVDERRIQAMWGESLVSGFTVVPWLLLRRQAELDVDSDEMLVLLHLIASWWHVDDLPFPRTSTIASRMKVSTRTAQRALQRLEKKKLVERVQGVGRNSEQVTKYDLSGLVQRLKELSLIPFEKASAQPIQPVQQTRAPLAGPPLRVVPNPSILFFPGAT